jgi:hypothetical protein
MLLEKMGFKYHGRYVDDFYYMAVCETDEDKQRMLHVVAVIRRFLRLYLHVNLHPNKFKFQYYACCHTHSKVNTEELLPELSHIFPETFLRAIIARFGNAHNDGKTKGEWYKEPVVYGCKGKLCSRPVNRACINV